MEEGINNQTMNCTPAWSSISDYNFPPTGHCNVPIRVFDVFYTLCLLICLRTFFKSFSFWRSNNVKRGRKQNARNNNMFVFVSVVCAVCGTARVIQRFVVGHNESIIGVHSVPSLLSLIEFTCYEFAVYFFMKKYHVYIAHTTKKFGLQLNRTSHGVKVFRIIHVQSIAMTAIYSLNCFGGVNYIHVFAKTMCFGGTFSSLLFTEYLFPKLLLALEKDLAVVIKIQEDSGMPETDADIAIKNTLKKSQETRKKFLWLGRPGILPTVLLLSISKLHFLIPYTLCYFFSFLMHQLLGEGVAFIDYNPLKVSNKKNFGSNSKVATANPSTSNKSMFENDNSRNAGEADQSGEQQTNDSVQED